MSKGASDKRLAEIAAKFKRDVEKLGLGVSISANGGEPVVITEAPKEAEDVAEAGRDRGDYFYPEDENDE